MLRQLFTNFKRCSLLALMLLFINQPHFANAIEDSIIAVVNDEIITLQDLRQYIKESYVGLVAEGYPEDRIQQIMLDLEINGLDKLIEDRLILSKASSLEMTIPEKRVEEEVSAVKSKYPSEELFLQSLIVHNATLTDLRNKITEQLKKRFVIEHEIRSKIYISPQEVTKYYNENLDRFQTQDVVMLDSLFLPFEDNQDVAFQKAHEALKLISSGEDFKSVASIYSKAPPLGKVSRGQLVNSVEEQIFKLQKGEVSDIIEVPTGLYIFEVTGKQNARIAPINEVKEKITNILFNKKYSERFQKWIQDLKSDAYIEIKK